MTVMMYGMQNKQIGNETKGLKEKLSKYFALVAFFSSFVEIFGDKFPYFVVLSSLGYTEPKEKQKLTSNQTTNRNTKKSES